MKGGTVVALSCSFHLASRTSSSIFFACCFSWTLEIPPLSLGPFLFCCPFPFVASVSVVTEVLVFSSLKVSSTSDLLSDFRLTF